MGISSVSGRILRATSRLALIAAAGFASAAGAAEVTLSSEDDGVQIVGELLSFEDGVYRVETIIGEIAIRADQVKCSGPGCPGADGDGGGLVAKPGEQVTVVTDNGAVRIEGTLVSYRDGVYEIDSRIGRLEILAEGTFCEGPGCPVPVDAADPAPEVETASTEPVEETPAVTEAEPAPLPFKTDFEVPIATIDGDPTIEIAGAASLIENLLPKLAEKLADDENRTVRVAATQPVESTRAAELGAPAGSLGFELADDAGDVQTILARLSEGAGAVADADITFISAPSGALGDDGMASFGLEALVPVVSPQNPLFAISATDLAAVFAGEITNWSEIGGSDQEITLIGHAPPHDLSVALSEQVLAPFGRAPAPGMERLATTTALIDMVTEDSGAIAFINAAQAEALKPLSILDSCDMPIAATASNIKTGRYPYARHLVVEASSADGLAGDLVASLGALLDAQGDGGIVPTGLGTYSLDEEMSRLRDSLNRIDDRFERLNTANALRMMAVAEKLSLRVAFAPGSNRFAEGSDAVFQEIIGFARDNALSEIFLVGFSENTGAVDRNRELGRNAARLAMTALGDADTDGALSETLVRTIGLGAVAPLACGEGADARNRRVEIWVRR